ncbi:Hypothetical predicted protein [Olea europaea subsp. europaea]|uniref:Uncharacterized protein n=1 Tax=Olea europaea subsp. europaea TaxID=158383 RepID=A0A8S0SY16_OLEEU|nr:Hypothetical predicted protein [Olea europaea subsp. europaea]
MSNLDLIEALPDNGIAMIGTLYFITAYLFSRDYKKIEICDLKLSKTEMRMPYMNGVQYNKPIQLKFSCDGGRNKSRTENSANCLGMSSQSISAPIKNSNIKQAHVPNDDNNFIDPPPRWQETSSYGKSSTDEDLLAAHHSPKKLHYYGMQWGDVSCYHSQL